MSCQMNSRPWAWDMPDMWKKWKRRGHFCKGEQQDQRSQARKKAWPVQENHRGQCN